MISKLLTVSLLLSIAFCSEPFLGEPSSFISEDIASIGCYLYADYAFYDLRPLQAAQDYVATNLVTGSRYTFNFCQYAQSPCSVDLGSAFAYREDTLGVLGCYRQTDDDYYPDEMRTSYTDEDTNSGIYFESFYSGGDLCNDFPASIYYEIRCDPTVVGRPSNFLFLDNDRCSPTIVFDHYAGCPVASADAFFAFLDEHPWVVGVLLICSGLVLTFYGAKFLPWVVGIVAGLSGFVLSMVFFSAIGWLDYIDPTLSDSADGSLGLAILSTCISLIIGGLVGVLFKIFFFWGFILIGFVLGFLCGTLLYSAFFLWTDSLWFLYLLEFGTGGVVAFLCFVWKDGLAIITTSALGAYATIKGIAEFAGGYPDELLLYQEIKNGTAEWEASYIAYMCGIVLLAILGVIAQTKMHHNAASDHFKSVQ